MSRTLLRRSLGLLGILLLLLSIPAVAQLPTTTLDGTVSDPSGAMVAGATVTAANNATGVKRQAVTGADGRYVFTVMQPGTYTLDVMVKGFTPVRVKDVTIEAGRALTVPVALKVATERMEVSVTEAAATVNLTQSEVQGQVEEATLQSIPLNGRNFLELAFLVPGNHATPGYDPTKTQTLEVSSAGQLGRGGNISVDGGDNNDEVVGGALSNLPEDAVREFQIATNRYTAEVGRSASSIINIVTKSGTNNYHGSAFLYERNRKLDALPATFDRTQCIAGQDCRPPLDRQQYGGSFGGPIKKDRAWLFVSAENRHQNAPVEVGFRDFSTDTIKSSAAPAPWRNKLVATRLDVKLSDRDTFYARYSYNQSLDTSAGSLHGGVTFGTAANRQTSLNRFNSYVLNWTRTISSNKVNSLIYHYDAFLNSIPAFSPNAPTFDTSAPGLGINPNGGAAEIVFQSLQDGQTFRAPQRTPFNRFQFRDNFAWTSGKHTLHFGGEFQHFASQIIFDLYGSSTIVLTQPFATQDLNGDGKINDLDIPIDHVLQATAPVRPPTAPQQPNNYLAGYFQDDWRVRPNLTLNLGLRYEYDTSLFGTDSIHDPCPAPPTVPTSPCIWLVNQGGGANGLGNALNLHRSSDPRDFSPRIGFAWDPTKKGATVVRGGYGIYYDRVVLEDPLLELLIDGRRLALAAKAGSTCNVAGVAASCSTPGARFDSGTPALAAVNGTGNAYSGGGGNIPIGLNVMDNSASHPIVQQFTLGLQQQIGSNWIVSGDVVHDYGTRFLMGREIRDANNNAVTVTDPLSGQTNNVVSIGSFARSWYDGLLVSVQKKQTKAGPFRYGFNLNYTLSKAFNYSSDDQIPFNTGAQADIIMGSNNVNLEKGYASTDERHHWTLFGSLSMPWNISVAPIWTLSSPVPGDVSTSLGGRIPVLPRDALGREIQSGADLNRVIDYWNGLPLCKNPGSFTNAGPFPCNTDNNPDKLGNIHRLTLAHVDPNAHFGSWFDSFDLRVTKGFKFAERHEVQVIAEAINLFNVTNIRGFFVNNIFGYNTGLDAQGTLNANKNFNKPELTAGGFVGSGGPRSFQFAIRYSF